MPRRTAGNGIKALQFFNGNPNEGNVGANSKSASESSSDESEDENEDASNLGGSWNLRQSIHRQRDVFPNHRAGGAFGDEGEQQCQDLWGDERAVDIAWRCSNENWMN